MTTASVATEARSANTDFAILANDGDLLARRLAPLFFVSGAAALIYQVCWQRLLFAAFGVDIDSVTIIVSVFMFGLGLGALVGGTIADRRPQLALLFFALSELGIGLFGWFSPDLIRMTGALFVAAPQWQIAIANFLLLLLPTCLMGATLPILVAHVTRRWGNVGKSIGMLYQVNTFGAAMGIAVVGFPWFLFFEIDTAIRMAAVLNILVSIITLFWVKRQWQISRACSR
ncbi:fused MFS/spermidine synthase [uncultured Thiodictyon sp.]|uniref:fused MFS/spermidine synthase n=1 Tax=uncultured Thiodictyon sp. TaxID=1846217 RepID=UPI0025E775DA|nr:fused MFS/spermidine synthase [uncultured Thiodictyon sp.]